MLAGSCSSGSAAATLRDDRAPSSPGRRSVAIGRAGGSGCSLDVSRSGSRGCTRRERAARLPAAADRAARGERGRGLPRDGHRIRDGLQRHGLQHRVAQRAHHRRGGVLPAGHRRGPARPRGPVPPAAQGRRARVDAPLLDPAGAGGHAARARDRRGQPGPHRDRRGPEARGEPAQRRVERRGRGVRRAGTDVAEPAEPAPVHGQGHDPGRRAGGPPRRGVRDEVRRRRPQRGLRRGSGCRAWRWSRPAATSPGTRAT